MTNPIMTTYKIVCPVFLFKRNELSEAWNPKIAITGFVLFSQRQEIDGIGS